MTETAKDTVVENKEQATPSEAPKTQPKPEAEKKEAKAEPKPKEDKAPEKKPTKKSFSKGGGKKRSPRKSDKPDDGFAEEVIDIARVTRVMGGGKRMSFRASVVVGDRKGKVGYGMGKSKEVQPAIQKAVREAKKKLLTVNLQNGTIPHQVRTKFKAARLIVIPASEGTGLIAGGVVRTVLELAGVRDILSKNYGTANKMSVAKATLQALASLKPVKDLKAKKETPKADKASKPAEDLKPVK